MIEKLGLFVLFGIHFAFYVPNCNATQSVNAEITGRWIDRQDHSFAFASTDATIPGVALQLIKPVTQLYQGTVLDSDGKPAAGAEVWFSGFYCKLPLRERTTTDKDGKYRIALPDLDDMGEVTWSATAIRDNESSASIHRPADKGVTLDLDQGRKLTVRAFESPADKTKPEIKNPISRFTLHLEDGRIVNSDDKGQCVVQGLPARVQYIGLTAPNRVYQFWMMDLFDDREVELEQTMMVGGTVTGTVYDEEKKPVPWNLVNGKTSERSSFLIGSVFTNKKGEYRLSGLPLNRKSEIAAFSHRFEDMTYLNDSNVEFAANSVEAKCDFEVTPNADPPPSRNAVPMVRPSKKPVKGGVRGRVTLPDGSPCTRFTLRLSTSRVAPKRSKGYSASYEKLGIVYSSPDGTFVFSDLEEESGIKLTASAIGFQEASVDPALAVSLDKLTDSESFDIQLRAAPKVRIGVRGPNAKPVADARVTLHRSDPDRRIPPYYKERFVSNGTTDSEGLLELTNVPLDSGRWIVEAPGYPEQQFAWRGETNATVALVEGVAVNLKFNIADEERDGEISLALVASDGQIAFQKEDIPLPNVQWNIPSLLPDRYFLQLYSTAAGVPLFQFTKNPGDPFREVLDLSEDAGKSKEFTFDLKPNVPTNKRD